MFGVTEREMADWYLETVCNNRIGTGVVNRRLTWGEIGLQHFFLNSENEVIGDIRTRQHCICACILFPTLYGEDELNT